ncbi:amino acid deaminase/aldolase [Glycomyces sp. TRM65418]|uniref:amino acid deaminase/aldolase n=1 Tax=Glycomyces sp. TRM65418 TaxID=2867006 RepID=UPI001CE5111B|nr:amino acid deaminase/aldolase [Glycomyces sp. TRM65418]MCC3762249.1 amino acid deaminase/aldolase [Glycomyces sp. TRM65418]QZD56308.1 amino acid deaminase/aldolase [Glycomyces sp. TRM65418]
MGYQGFARTDAPPARGAAEHRFAELGRATAGLQPPFAVVDLGAFDTNAAILRRNAIGKPLRLVSKSLRCRALMRRALAQPGFKGVLGFTLPEALWLAESDAHGEFDDIVVAYPTADTDALRRLAADEELARRITLMVDSVEHLDFLHRHVAPNPSRPLRLCLELDVSLELLGGRLHIGAHRSPVHTPEQAIAMAHEIDKRPGVDLVGVMGYESQIAGIQDAFSAAALRYPLVRLMQRVSRAELAERRAEAVVAVRSVADLEFVNGGGTGSVVSTAADPSVTEIAAGSGLYSPALFDGYRSIRPLPAAFFALPVVRRPRAGLVTALGGGWVASGVPGPDRLPKPAFPGGLRYTKTEGAGEVQTPLRGRAADGLAIGDRVWMRHGKAGELAERVNSIHLVLRGEVVDEVPTYRGEGRAFA